MQPGERSREAFTVARQASEARGPRARPAEEVAPLLCTAKRAWVSGSGVSQTAELPPSSTRAEGRTWLPVDLLRDAGVVALLHAGERERARKVFIALARASTRGVEDLRTVVLQQAMVGK